jgi:hypothetical protein
MGQRKTTIQSGAWSPSWGYSKEASASMALYPTNQNRSAGTNYWVTGSTIIPASALNTGSFFVTSSTGLGPVNTSAKVSITSSYFTPFFNSKINDSNDVKKFAILSYNGVISTIAGYNDFSSSTFNNYTQSFVVMHISASKANMGSVVTNNLIVSLGTTQNSSNTNARPTNTITANAAFEAKYPTNKSDWTSINGVLTSPKNQ